MSQQKSEHTKRALIRNPKRVLGEFTEAEMEVVKLAKSKAPQKRVTYTTITYEYWAPFNYPNVIVEIGRDDSGGEYNMDGVELDIPPFGAITIEEEEPIVGVEVIGSACITPGYVILHAEPLEWKYPRTGVKMKVENLWGEHVLGLLWRKGVDEGYRHAGMSSARFSVPESRKVTIMCGAPTDIEAKTSWTSPSNVTTDDPGKAWNDAHYCVRIIRVTVKVSTQENK